MDNRADLSPEQLAAFNEQLERGAAFDEFSRAKGYELLKAYITFQVQAFANKALSPGFTSLEDYREAKGEVNGLRKLLAHIDGDIKALQDEQQRQRQAARPTTDDGE